MPRTLLVTSASPVIQSAGSVFLKSLIEPESAPFHWFVLGPRDSESHSFAQASLEYAYPAPAGRHRAPSPDSLGFRIKHWVRQKFGEGPSKLWKQWPLIRREAPALANRLLEICTREKIEVIWFVVDSTPLLTYLLACIASRWTGGLALNIHDPPTREADLLGFPFNRALEHLILTHLKQGLRKANSVAVASSNMRKLYSVPDAEVLIHGPDRELIRPAALSMKDPATLQIGFAGSLYAEDTWYSFLHALDSIHWKLDGRQIKIKLLGIWKPEAGKQISQNVEMLGWATPERCLEVLCECDMTYLPYWFGHDSSVQNCFPNKLSMYLAAGVPVFYHGPKPSSPDDFLREFRAGVSCNTTSAGVIVNDLSHFLNPDTYRQFAQESRRAALEQLNLQVFQAAFRRFILLAAPERS